MTPERYASNASDPWIEMMTLATAARQESPRDVVARVLELMRRASGGTFVALYHRSPQGSLNCETRCPAGDGGEPLPPTALVCEALGVASGVVGGTGADWVIHAVSSDRVVAVCGGNVPHFADRFGAYAAICALALEREALLATLHASEQIGERRLREVGSLYEMSQALQGRGLDDFLQAIVSKAATVMAAQACSLLLLNTGDDCLTIGASCGLPATVVESARVPIGEGIAGKVARSGEVMLVSDPNLHPQLSGHDVETRPEIASSICVPLRDLGDKVFGVLSIRRLRPAEPFTPDDARLFELFGRQAALALTNSTLNAALNKRVGELSALASLTSSILTPLDPKSLLESVADSVVRCVGIDRCAIFLLNSKRMLVPRTVRGYAAGTFPSRGYRLGRGVIGFVAARLIPIVVTAARTAIQPLRGFARAIGTDSFLALPVLCHGRPIGVLLADTRSSDADNVAERIDLLTTFANQAGIALENARLYQEMQVKLAEIRNLAGFRNNVLRSLGTGVLSVGTDGIITMCNAAASDILGLPARSTIGQSFSAVLEGQFEGTAPVALSRQVTQALASRTRVVWVGHLSRTSGDSLDLEITASPLQPDKGRLQGAVVLMDDVTGRRALERKMDRMERLAEIGQLTATMAHEIRNPLTSIKGAAQFLTNECELPDTTREFVGIILDEVNSLTQISDEFLEFARPLDVKPVEGDINSAVARTLQSLRPFATDHGVMIDWSPATDLPTIGFDPLRCGQALRNLVINAVQAMPRGGVLRVTTEHHEQRGLIEIAFADTGVGIAPENMERIFTPFFTTKTKGTGLGLSVVQKIMGAHHGRATVRSIWGEGTVFSLWLPLRPGDDTTHSELRTANGQISKSTDS